MNEKSIRKKFRNLIQAESEILNTQQNQIHQSFANRKNDWQAWTDACAIFHSYISPMDEYIDRACLEQWDYDLIEFTIMFLELDAWFFRSGYIKETLLCKLKHADLTAKHVERLNSVLLDAVECRGQREFKRYCRLARKIATPKLIYQLEVIIKHAKPSARRSRAKLMLNIIHSNGSEKE